MLAFGIALLVFFNGNCLLTLLKFRYTKNISFMLAFVCTFYLHLKIAFCINLQVIFAWFAIKLDWKLWTNF